MKLTVHAMCSYYPKSAEAEHGSPSQGLWDSRKFCTAVKDGTIRGYLTFTGPNGLIYTINENNPNDARRIFGSFVAKIIKTLDCEPLSIIPVPSKDALIGESTFRSLSMLEATRGDRKWTIEPYLRFTKPLQKASNGGPRNRTLLAHYMRLVAQPSSKNVVIIDDICTSGNHLLACQDILAKAGCTTVAAIVCGHTDHNNAATPFITKKFDIPDDNPFDF